MTAERAATPLVTSELITSAGTISVISGLLSIDKNYTLIEQQAML